jgi:predicted nucleotidyltransferase
MDDHVICRWRIDDLIFDVMPTDEKILSFSNRWYEEAIQNKVSYTLTDSVTIYSVTAPYFLATKLEAFKERGKSDYIASHDLEDIIAVIDGRPELVNEVHVSQGKLKDYLVAEITSLLDNQQFQSALPGHLGDYGSIANDRANIVIERLRKMMSETPS